MSWINRVLTNEESPEAKLLRQRLLYIGGLMVFAAVVGLMPVYQDWTIEPLNAVIVGIFGVVLIVLDIVQTWIGLKMTGQNEPVTELVVGTLSSTSMVGADGSPGANLADVAKG